MSDTNRMDLGRPSAFTGLGNTGEAFLRSSWNAFIHFHLAFAKQGIVLLFLLEARHSDRPHLDK